MPRIESTPTVMTVMDAARALGIGIGMAYRMAELGTLPGVIKIGKRYMVARQVIDKVLAEGYFPEKKEEEVI